MKAPRDVLTYFDELHKRTRGLPALFTRPKDPALAKRLLETYSWEHITGLLDTFFVMSDDFIGRAGYSMGVFVGCLPKVIAEWDRRRARTKMATPLTVVHCRDCDNTGWVGEPAVRCPCRMVKAKSA